MYYEKERLSVDEGAEIIQRQYGLPLTREGLLEVCDSGWPVCHFDEQGQWTIDPDELARDAVPRELAQRIERLAADRQDADGAMREPPGDAEARGF